jgi:hypothetical protein
MRQVLAIETESAETIEADGRVLMGDNPGPLSSRGIGPAVAAHCPPLAVGSGSGASGSATGLGGLSLSSLMGASPTPRAVSIVFGAFRRTRFVFVLGAIVRTGGQIFVSPLKFAISRSSSALLSAFLLFKVPPDLIDVIAGPQIPDKPGAIPRNASASKWP